MGQPHFGLGRPWRASQKASAQAAKNLSPIVNFITWAFRKAALIPWLACACAADPRRLPPILASPWPSLCRPGNWPAWWAPKGRISWGAAVRWRWMATPTSPAAGFSSGARRHPSERGKSEMALSCGDEIRCFSKVGFPTRRLACPAAGPTLQVDLNDDGQEELVAISQGQLLIFAGNSPTVIDAGRIPLALAAGDPNGDGKMDLGGSLRRR